MTVHRSMFPGSLKAMAFWLRSSSLSADNLSASCLCRCVSCTRISCGQENRFLQVCKKMVWIWINPVAFYTPFNGLRPSPSAKTSQLRHWVRLHTGLVLRWVLGVLCMGLATVQNKTSSHSGTWPLQLTSIYLIPSHPISSLLRSSLSVYLSLTVHFSAFLPIVHPFSSDFSGPSGSPGLAVAPRVGARSGPSMAPSDTWTPTWWLLQDQSRACRNHVEVMSKLWIKKASNHLQPSPTKSILDLNAVCRLRHEAMAPGLLVEKPISSTALVRVTQPLKNIKRGTQLVPSTWFPARPQGPRPPDIATALRRLALVECESIGTLSVT